MIASDEHPKGFSRRDALILAGVGAAAFTFADLTGDASSATAVPLWTSGWGSPLNGSISLTASFLDGAPGNPPHPPYVGNDDFHTGLDMAAAAGASVHSIAAGVVLYLKFDAEIGNAALIQHTAFDGTNFLAIYGHINLSVGQGYTVAPGQQIGSIFAWDSPHLHFGLRTDISNPARWGARQITNPLSLDSFTNPIPFLDAHPNNSMPQTIMEEDLAYVIIQGETAGDATYQWLAIYGGGVKNGWVEISPLERSKFNTFRAITDWQAVNEGRGQRMDAVPMTVDLNGWNVMKEIYYKP